MTYRHPDGERLDAFMATMLQALAPDTVAAPEQQIPAIVQMAEQKAIEQQNLPLPRTAQPVDQHKPVDDGYTIVSRKSTKTHSQQKDANVSNKARTKPAITDKVHSRKTSRKLGKADQLNDSARQINQLATDGDTGSKNLAKTQRAKLETAKMQQGCMAIGFTLFQQARAAGQFDDGDEDEDVEDDTNSSIDEGSTHSNEEAPCAYEADEYPDQHHVNNLLQSKQVDSSNLMDIGSDRAQCEAVSLRDEMQTKEIVTLVDQHSVPVEDSPAGFCLSEAEQRVERAERHREDERLQDTRAKKPKLRQVSESPLSVDLVKYNKREPRVEFIQRTIVDLVNNNTAGLRNAQEQGKPSGRVANKTAGPSSHIPFTPTSDDEFTMGEPHPGQAEGDQDLPIQLMH
ncbi:hypothetical protein PHMEG_0004608 [Phytophthora megakarya]|uniref:Uncharacterized protein n=1 Tax=Phytophthora megakarya TaxID=4795 RepID=A0A225WTG8_9STRA|nr:hypothetical protein PHMEG_0004608 [Phytophthora megakarya]